MTMAELGPINERRSVEYEELRRAMRMSNSLAREHKYPVEIAHIHPSDPNFPVVGITRSNGGLYCFSTDVGFGDNFTVFEVKVVDGLNHITPRPMNKSERVDFLLNAQNELCLGKREIEPRVEAILRKAKERDFQLRKTEEVQEVSQRLELDDGLIGW